MKFYKSVIEKVQETNYKKGITRIDTNSGYYTVSKVLYYLAFAWFMFFQISYLFSNTMAFFFFKEAAGNIHTELFVTSWIVFVLLVAGLVLIKLKFHIAAFASNLVGAVAQMVVLNTNENISLAFLESGFLSNKFFWYHYAPAILIILFTLIICIIGVKSYIQFKNDYKKAMAAMFAAYTEVNPNVSDVEWQQHLADLDEKKEASQSLKGKK